MSILSFGDCIVPGKYCLHSRFTNVVNYSFNQNFLSIVSKKIDNGPVNIVIDDILKFRGNEIIIKSNSLLCNDFFYNFEDDLQYNSEINHDVIADLKIEAVIKMLLPLLEENAPILSLAFVFNENRKKYFKSSFEMSFINKISAGIEKLQAGKAVECAEMIHGFGFGLTPSGDDFITGMLYALYLLQEITGKENLVSLRNNVCKAAESENIISLNSMKMAANGRFGESFKNMVFALAQNNERDICEAVHNILNMGATSGADMLTGFLCTFITENRYTC
jgi:Protein of unknown function (DUF2877)